MKKDKQKILPIKIAIAMDENENWFAFGQNIGSEETFIETLQVIISSGQTDLGENVNFYVADAVIPVPEKIEKKKTPKKSDKEKPSRKFSKKYNL